MTRTHSGTALGCYHTWQNRFGKDVRMLDLSMLTGAVRHEGGVSRRLFLAYTASLSAVPWLGRTATAAHRQRSFARHPFQLGVASGDPTPTGVVLWTRLAPQPLEP